MRFPSQSNGLGALTQTGNTRLSKIMEPIVSCTIRSVNGREMSHPPPLQALHPRSPTVLSLLYLQIFRASLRNPFYPRVQARFRPRMHEPSFLLVNKRARVLCGSEQHPFGCASSVCVYRQLVVLFEQDNPVDHA